MERRGCKRITLALHLLQQNAREQTTEENKYVKGTGTESEVDKSEK